MEQRRYTRRAKERIQEKEGEEKKDKGGKKRNEEEEENKGKCKIFSLDLEADLHSGQTRNLWKSHKMDAW